MQFRQQGSRTQVLAYQGYDRERKRAVVSLLGSFDTHNPVPPDELLSKLTDDQKVSLQSHIETIRQSQRDNVNRSLIESSASHIDLLSDSLTRPSSANLLTPEVAADVYRAVDRLTKQLRKLGHSKPAKTLTVG